MQAVDTRPKALIGKSSGWLWHELWLSNTLNPQIILPVTLNLDRINVVFGISTTKTWDTRYDEMGITGYIHQYANNHRKVLNVIDVGCSTAIATKTAQECLKKHGTEIKTTGIDSSAGVESDARKNLDHFEKSNVNSSEADRYVGKADVVICANVANWAYKLLSRRDTAGIIKRCSEFLKKDGILVTDAPDADRVPGISHLEWQRANLCPEHNCKSGTWRKSNVYRKI